MTRATLYVPPFVLLADVNDVLHRYCEVKGYEIAAVDTDGKPWWDSLEAAHEMGVDRIVVADPAHLPDDWAPRVEIADLTMLRPDLPGLGQDRPKRRRPRPL